MPRYSIRWLDTWELQEVAFDMKEAWRKARFLSFGKPGVLVVDEQTHNIAIVCKGKVL